MWLAVTSIALASAIVFNVIALCLIDWFEKNLPEILIVHTAKHEFSTIRELGHQVGGSQRSADSIVR
jgi:hypothetical protein